jgi:hypothetical protein
LVWHQGAKGSRKVGKEADARHAGAVTLRVRSGKMGEAVRTYLDSVVPAMREQPGFVSILL